MKLNIKRLKELEQHCEVIRIRLALIQADCDKGFDDKPLMIQAALAEKDVINLQMDLVYAMQHDGEEENFIDNPLPDWDGIPNV